MSTYPRTPLNMPDPGPPPVPTKTLTRWDAFIGDLASGVPLAEAMEKRYITRADIETMYRLDDGGIQKQRFDDAERAGRKLKWTVFEIKDIFGFVAEGMNIKDAQLAAKGTYSAHFAQLIVEDPDLNAMYRKALEARSLGVVEEAISIVDDDSRDTLDNGKGGQQANMAAVGRDKLRSDIRLRVAASWNTRLYGEKKDQVNVQVNINHAEQLEASRARAKSRGTAVTPKQLTSAIDAVFSEKPAEADPAAGGVEDAWDTQWREEK